MIKQPAKVISETDSTYILETIPKSACPKCEEGKGCGGGILAKAFANKAYRLLINKEKPLKLQQMVNIGISSSTLIRASIILYFVPLVFMVFTAIITGSLINNQDLYTVISAIGGFIAGVMVARLLSDYYLKQDTASVILLDDKNSDCWYTE